MARLSILLLTFAWAGPALAGSPVPPDPNRPAAPPAPADPPPVVRQVGEVIATSRGELGNLELPGNITVIDRPAIEESGALDVPDLLRREAGVFVTNDTTSPEGYRVELRGFNNGSGGGSSTLVLVDGRRVNEPDSATTDWALIHLDNVERIEILRGPVNAIWGDNSQAGVINIITRSGDGPPRFELRGNYGAWDTYGGSVFAGGSHGPLRASLFLNGSNYGGYRDRSRYRDHGGLLKLGFDLGDLASLDLQAGYQSDERERPGTLSWEEIDLLGRRAAEPSTDDNEDTTRAYNVDGTLRLFLAEDVVWKTTAWYTSRRDRGALGNATFAFETDTETQAVGTTNQLEVRRAILGHANQLVVGGDWLEERVSSDFTTDVFLFPPPLESRIRAKRRTYGVFLQDDFNILPCLILSGGVRYDRDDRSGHDPLADLDLDDHNSAWSPRAALTWRVLDTLSLYGSWSHGFRFPNLNETFDFFGLLPSLHPEKSVQYEVGAKWRSERADANLAFYQMDVRNEILLDPFVGFPFGQSVNMARVRHRGVEFSAQLRPWPWLELYGSYTYDDVEIRRDTLTALDGSRIPMVPRNRGTVGARVFGPCHTEAGINANLVGSRPFLNDLGNDFERLGPYQVVDAHFAWRPELGEHVRLGFEANVYNVFDEDYAEVGGLSARFDPVTFAPFRQERFFPSPTRGYGFRVLLELRQ